MNFAPGKKELDLSDQDQQCCECDACGRRTQFVHLRVRWYQVACIPLLPLGFSDNMKCKYCGASPTRAQMSAQALAYNRVQRRAAFFRGTLVYLCGIAALVGLTCTLIFGIKLILR